MLSRKHRLIRAAAALTAIGATAATAMVGSSAAQADPIQYDSPLRGYGSDTIQDVTNAFAGFSNGVQFPPLVTGSSKVIASWDAFPANTCIAPASNFGLILRPNGSSNGQRVLSAAKNGFQWPFSATTLCGGQKSVPSALVSFARSSSGPGSLANPNGAVTWIPFSRDALSFAYTRPAGSPLTTLTTAQLTALHATGPQLISDVPVIACGIQLGSGTYGTWVGNIGLSSGGDTAGTAVCNNAGGVPDANGRLQENNGPELIAKGNLLSSMSDDVCDGVVDGNAATCENAQLVVGFSASQYVARSNGVGSPDPDLEGTGFSGMGAIDSLGVPVSCTGPNSCSPVGSFYSDANYGRDVYFIAPTNDVTGFLADPNLVDMFVGASSQVCQAGDTIEQHGFLQIGNCGATTLRGAYRTP